MQEHIAISSATVKRLSFHWDVSKFFLLLPARGLINKLKIRMFKSTLGIKTPF